MAVLGLVLGLVVLGGGGFAAWSYLGGAPASSQAASGPTRCGSEAVVIAASRDLAPALHAALIDAGCTNVDVRGIDPVEVSRTLVSGVGTPDYWVPDSSLWVERAQPVARTAPETLVDSLATSPVVLASAGAEAPRTWADALTEPTMVMGDPLTNTTAAVPLLLGTADASAGQAALMVAPLAQAQADTAAPPMEDHHRVDWIEAADAGVTSTSEQQLLASGSDLVASIPAPGTWLLDYPLVLTATPTRATQIAEVSRRLGEFSQSPELAEELAVAQFRPASGAAIEGGVGGVSPVPMPTADALAARLGAWSTLAVPIRSLAVVARWTSRPRTAAGWT